MIIASEGPRSYSYLERHFSRLYRSKEEETSINEPSRQKASFYLNFLSHFVQVLKLRHTKLEQEFLLNREKMSFLLSRFNRIYTNTPTRNHYQADRLGLFITALSKSDLKINI